MRPKSLPLVAGALVVLMAVPVAGEPTRDPVLRTIELRPGRPVFWHGPPNWDAYEGEDRYVLVVRGRPARLRVGIDQGSFYALGLRLFGPDRREAGFTYSPHSGEIVIPRPRAGRWLVLVEHYERGVHYRMRATLDRPKRPVGSGPLLPNLQMVPPFEFTFWPPLIGFPPAGFAGVHNGCFADEIVAYGASRCLRFSTGPGNVGAGHLMLDFEPSPTATAGNVTQRIQYADGRELRVPAGTYEYHPAHLHFHHAGFGGFELYRVVDERNGLMAAAGRGPKLGFCMADYLLVRWRSFANAPRDTVGSNCAGTGDSPAQPMFTGLTQGWADLYGWYQEGMFVDFANNPDGLYVVRARANANNSIMESDARDNESYALIRVSGYDIEVLERGFGASPWDPRRIPARDLLPLYA